VYNLSKNTLQKVTISSMTRLKNERFMGIGISS
jgi:hypothetical protein